MASLAKLARLGAEALRPQFIGGVWRKAAISAKNQAKLRKAALLDGRDWFGDTGAPITPPKRRKPKGHKWERLRVIRHEQIAANMATMDEKIAAYRESKKLQDKNMLDLLTLSTKQRRLKDRGS